MVHVYQEYVKTAMKTVAKKFIWIALPETNMAPENG